jgi:hypothetical protein
MRIEPSCSTYASRVSYPRVVESLLKISELWGPSGEEKVVADHVVDQEEHTVHEHIKTSALLEGSRVVVSLIQQAVESAPKALLDECAN